MTSDKQAPRRRFLRPVILAILVVGLGTYFFVKRASNQLPPGVIMASGTIEADETIVSPKVPGKLAKLNVDEGSDVKKGQLLAKLDDTELSEQLQQAIAAYRAAEAKYHEAVNGNRPQQIAEAEAQLIAAKSTASGSQRVFQTARRNMQTVLDLRTQLDTAEAKVPASEAAYLQAVQALKLAKAGSRPDQIQVARAALTQAKVALEKAQIDLVRMKTLSDQGAIAVQSYDDAKATHDLAVQEVDQAQSRLDDLLAGSRPEEIHEAEQAVAQAKANLEGARKTYADARKTFQDRLTAQSQLDSQKANSETSNAQVAAAASALDLMRAGSRTEDIQNAKATRDQAKHAADYADELVKDTFLYAPADGVIKTKDALVGETLGVGSPVVTVADLDHIWIRVYVPENQYGVLKLGQAVDVTVDSFPNEKFRGRIVSINSDSEFTPKDAQTTEERVTLVFGVKIAVENPGRRLKPGMPGDALIHFQ